MKEYMKEKTPTWIIVFSTFYLGFVIITNWSFLTHNLDIAALAVLGVMCAVLYWTRWIRESRKHRQ